MTEPAGAAPSPPSQSPLDRLNALATVEVRLRDDLRHIEAYTPEGLLTFFWHGPADAENVMLMCGGALGGVLGPARGLYHGLATTLGSQGVGTIRVGYRRPNDVVACVHDLLAAAELTMRSGAERFVTMGHSFGGAAALQAAALLEERAVGCVTFATQSAGCEPAEGLAERVPVLLFHGDRDELLPAAASEMTRMLIGGGELVVLPGAGHLLTEAATTLRERLLDWVPARFADDG